MNALRFIFPVNGPAFLLEPSREEVERKNPVRTFTVNAAKIAALDWSARTIFYFFSSGQKRRISVASIARIATFDFIIAGEATVAAEPSEGALGIVARAALRNAKYFHTSERASFLVLAENVSPG